MGVSGNLSQEVCTESHYAQDQHVPRDTGILYFPLIYIKYFPSSASAASCKTEARLFSPRFWAVTCEFQVA